MKNSYLVSNFETILLKVSLGLLFLIIVFCICSFLFFNLSLVYITAPLILLTIGVSTKNIRYGILFFIFLIPLLTQLPQQLGVPNFSIIEIIFLTLLLVWFAKLILAPGIKMIKTPLDFPLFLYILVVIGSCITVLWGFRFIPGKLFYYKLAEFANNIFVWNQIDEFFTIRAMITLLEGVLFYFLIVNNIRAKAFVNRILITLIASSGVVSIYGLLQYIFKFNLLEYWVKLNPDITRINSTLPDVNSYASYLLLILVLTFNMFLSHRGKKKLLMAAVIALLVFNLTFTYSRIALAALFAAFIINLLLISKTKLFLSFKSKLVRTGYRKILSAALISVLVPFLVLFSIAQFVKVPIEEQTSLLKIALFSLNIDRSFYITSRGRMVYWSAAVAMIKSQPMFGVGVGSYIRNLPKYIDTSKYWIRSDENAHNYFLQMTSEMGFLFLSIYLFILAFAFSKAINSLKYIKDNFSKFILIGILCGLIAFLLTCLTGHPLLLIEMQFIFWFFIALIFIIRQSIIPYQPSPNRIKKLGLILAVAILISIPIRAYFNHRYTLPITSHGFYDWEKWQNNIPFQWTKRIASQQLKVEGEILFIPLISFDPTIAKKPLKVQIFFNGTRVDQVIFKDNLPHILNYPLLTPVHKELIISYATNKTWNPMEKKISSDWRNLGVAVGKISWDKPPDEWYQLGFEPAYGFYCWENWLSKFRFRWMKKKAHMRLQVEGDKLIIPMMCSYTDDNNPQQVNIYINYSLAERIILPDNQWKDIEIKVPEQELKEIILTIEAQRVWNPAQLGISNDNRNLGIAVGEMSWKN